VANRRKFDTFIRMMGKNARFTVVAMVLTLALLLQAWPAASQEVPEPSEVITLVQKKYDRAGSFKTWFRQETAGTLLLG